MGIDEAMTGHLRRPPVIASAAILAAAALSQPALACSSCGCTLSSDWDTQGLSTNAGLRIDLRYDYIDQNQLRHDSGTASADAVAKAQAAGTLGETEQYTKNRYYTLGIDYSGGRTWGVNVQLPYVDRSHGTLAYDANAGVLDTDVSTSHTESLGDVRVIGRYQGLSPDGDVGLLFGLKLPTGRHDYTFSGGPLAGSPLDRSLQPGSGSTDLLLGAYTFGSLSRDWDWFALGLAQRPVRIVDEFRPGSALNLSLGVRYMGFESVMPQLQINARAVAHDEGMNADPENSGGSVAYLSPGLTVPVSRAVKLYGFIQLPLYQRVNGFQLAPRWNASVGVNFAF